jgi:hypothetical protein
MKDEKLIEIGKWLNKQGYDIDLTDCMWMEECRFEEHKTRDIIELLEAYHEYKQEPKEKPKRYKCLLCGRDKFTQKAAHICNRMYRRRGLKWEEIH